MSENKTYIRFAAGVVLYDGEKGGISCGHPIGLIYIKTVGVNAFIGRGHDRAAAAALKVALLRKWQKLVSIKRDSWLT
jgi:hypothetical protein